MFQVGLAGRSVPTTFDGSFSLRSAFPDHFSHEESRRAKFHNQSKPRLWLDWGDFSHIPGRFGKDPFAQMLRRLNLSLRYRRYISNNAFPASSLDSEVQ